MATTHHHHAEHNDDAVIGHEHHTDPVDDDQHQHAYVEGLYDPTVGHTRTVFHYHPVCADEDCRFRPLQDHYNRENSARLN